MKKATAAILLILLLLLSTIAVIGETWGETEEGYTYVVSADEATITSYTGTSLDLDIPDMVDGYPVTAIGFGAFMNRSDLTGTLFIPHSVISIGDYAFYGCSSLSGGLNIPGSVSSIGDYAFGGCSSLTGNLLIPNNVTIIGPYAFEACDGFTGSLSISNNVSRINEGTFFRCGGLTGNLTVPLGITSIGNNAFSGCSGFSGTLYIPNSVTSLGQNAFWGCGGLTGGLWIPINLTGISEGTFSNCSGLTGGLLIPASVTDIRAYAFSGCSGLTGDLSIPANVTSIGDYAFSGCSGFTGDLVIPDTVDSIGAFAFEACNGFDGILNISTSITGINEGTFFRCGSLTGNIDLPSGVMSIGRDAFSGCHSFDGTLTIPDSVTIIGNSAFYDCSGLTGSLFIPDGLSKLEDFVFYGCSALTGSFVIPSSVTSIGNYAFAGCTGLSGDLDLPSGIISIGSYAFAGCDGFTGSLTIPNNLTSISEGTFFRCRGLTGDLIIPFGVTSIGNEAFSGCDSLNGSLSIPNTVLSIGGYAFCDCSRLSGSLTLPDNLTEIEDSVFYGCRNLSGPLSIPSGITRIGSYSLFDCGSLSGSLIIPAGVTGIDDAAFYGCSGLLDVYLLTQTYRLGNETFQDSASVFYGYPKTPMEDYAADWDLTFIPFGISLLGETSAVTGQMVQITATAVLLPGEPSELTWQSSDESVATVDLAGLVTAIIPGRTMITASSENFSSEFSFEVTKAVYDMSAAAWIYEIPFTYDGLLKTVAVTGLPADVWIESYQNNTATDSGDYTASVILGYDEIYYEKPEIKDLSWTINPLEISIDWSGFETRAYDGTAFDVTAAAIGLADGDSCQVTVRGGNETNVGAYTAAATGIDNLNYFLPRAGTEQDYTITPKIIDLAWTGWDTRDYNASASDVSAQATGLVERDICTVSVTGGNEVNAGTHTATAREIDNQNYALPAAGTEQAYVITPKVIGLTWSGWITRTYDETASNVAASATGLAGTDTCAVTVTGGNNINAGTHTAAAASLDNTNYALALTGTTQTYIIEKASYDMSRAGWDDSSAFTYDGEVKTVGVIGLPSGVTAKSYLNNSAVNAGTYQASVVLGYDAVNYEQPTLAALDWTIHQKVVGLMWNGWETRVYNGTASNVTALATGLIGQDLCGVFVSGGNKTNTGTHNAAATGVDHPNYALPAAGTTQAYTITPKVIGLEWSGWTTRTYDTRPSNVTAAATGLINDDPCYVTVRDGNETNAGTYTATAAAISNPNYSLPSTGIQQNYMISKAIYSMTGADWDYALPFTYNGSAKTVSVTGLPGGVTASGYIGHHKTDAGTYTASVTLSYDTVNYEQPAIENLTWEILKAAYDMDQAQWDYNAPFTYDGFAKTVSVTGLPAGVTASGYTGHHKTDAGTYTASAALNYDTVNYEQPFLINLTWEILKTQGTLSNISDKGKVYNALPVEAPAYEKTGDGLVTAEYFTGTSEDGTLSAAPLAGSPENAGKYTVRLYLSEGSNWLGAIADKSFVIQKAAYDMSAAQWDYTAPFTYDGSVKTVGVTGLPASVSATGYSGHNKTNAGTSTASVILSYDTVNYEQPVLLDLTWEILKTRGSLTNISDMGKIYNASPVGAPTYEKTGDGIVSMEYFTGTLADGNLSAAPLSGPPLNAGNYTIKLYLSEGSNWLGTTADQAFTILKASYDMSAAQWDYTAPFTYDGSSKTVNVTGLPTGVTALSYSGHIKTDADIYTASVVLGYDSVNYEQPILLNLTWEILKNQGSLTNISDITKVYDASPVGTPTYETTGDGLVTVKYFIGTSADGNLSATFLADPPVNAGKYTARLQLSDGINWLGTMADQAFTILKASYDMGTAQWDYTGPFTYSGSAKTVSATGLPTGVTASGYHGHSHTNVGTYTASVILGYDAVNYEQPEIDKLKWNILKAAYDMSRTEWEPSTPFTYDGSLKTVVIKGLPAGVTAAFYLNNTAIDAGSYTAKATLAYDSANYEKPEIPDLAWEILKAPGALTNLSDTGKVYDGTPVEVPTYTKTGDAGVNAAYFRIEIIDSQPMDVAIPDAPADAGEYKVRLTMPQGTNYLAAQAETTFIIQPKMFAGTILVESQLYTGNNLTPLADVTDETMGSLIPGIDYLINYNNNVGPGRANVDISFMGNFTGSVSGGFDVISKVSNITLNPASAEVAMGSSLSVSAQIIPNHATDKSLTWSSGSTAIATVDSSGKVTPVSVGQTMITATALDGSKISGACGITVVQKVMSLLMEPNALTLDTGSAKILTVSVSPQNATNKTLTWTSSNSTVVSVDNSGLINALTPGTATIKAAAQDGSGLNAVCEITVVQKVTGVLPDPSSITMLTGKTTQILAMILPGNATAPSLNWISSDISIATVSSQGLVTAVSRGFATITATATDGSERSGSCAVTIIPPDGWLREEAGLAYYQNGLKLTGWLRNSGKWYFMDPDGFMLTGWHRDAGSWYYLSASGPMSTGWNKVGGSWYYFAQSGAMKTGWLFDAGSWYYLSSSGAMKTGWASVSGTWYYMNESGSMRTGWLLQGGAWYYLLDSGAMATGTRYIDGRYSNFSAGGVWLGYK